MTGRKPASVDHFDADALHQRVGRGELVAAHVVGDRLVDSDLDGDSFQDAVTVGDVGHRQYEVRSRDLASVFVDDAFGNAAQFDFERRAGLLPFLDDS